MRVKLFWNFLAFFLTTTIISVESRNRPKKNKTWGGTLSFQDDFDGFELKKDHWTLEERCHGKGRRDTNLECFSTSDENLRVWNGTLLITAIHKPATELRLFSSSKNFTSARLSTNTGFSYGTFVISARLPKGKGLTPSIWLRPGYTDHDNCKYEEIEIVTGKGNKNSNLILSASFGRNFERVAKKRVEKSFPGIDFSQDFHEFALDWRNQPPRLDWYLDGVLVFTASTYFYSDWILSDETNVPCSRDKSLFKQPLQLVLSLSVGGGGVGGHQSDYHKESPITLDEVTTWEKPTLEIDWVKVYQT